MMWISLYKFRSWIVQDYKSHFRASRFYPYAPQ